ncbi:acyl-CoA dehydrogenase family protein [Frigidibacter sp. ROC022]|uniref:acyl-CoA dehydrogenase family protein n=1 Tax=Frigidibacter sp. ROC022 TaxID=2971796 RepID=UPI00215A2345|nr:acyl-CoA dehydrogenase family protein [Frigidibacter sp. ROC022]MCR8723268.1 acyl-CoA dehydrogenase family protein [Frigidibacter sp. ROC022]
MTLPPQDRLPGHDVTNQPPEPGDLDLWAGDPALRESVLAQGGPAESVAAHAWQLGRRELRDIGREANRRLPELVGFDRGGRRLDEVRFDAAYHRMMTEGLGAGYAAMAWDGTPGGHVGHAALVYLHSQVEPGTCCPMTMTYAAVPALEVDPDLAALWRPKLVSRVHDPAVAPVARKRGATLGMAMTEKQGGSDIRSNATRALPEGDAYRLQGHKWFCSAPMSDGFLTLAQAPGGLTCFLVPRWLEGERNAIHLIRLKDKLGNRANASAEIEYHGALAQRLGDEGQGVRTILKMVHHTRLDTAMAPAGLMRAALVEAMHWARHRSVFQRRLADQPLMAAVLADLALDWEGTLALGLRVARAFDGQSRADRGFARIGVALAKFLSNKLAPGLIVEAMEALGGIGYIEESPLPMLYREAPLNGIWEGSGNVIALDIARTLERDKHAAEALRAELNAARGAHPAYDAALAALPAEVPESAARQQAERLATLLSAATLFAVAPPEIAAAYAASRLAPRSRLYGTAPDLPVESLLARFAV